MVQQIDTHTVPIIETPVRSKNVNAGAIKIVYIIPHKNVWSTTPVRFPDIIMYSVYFIRFRYVCSIFVCSIFYVSLLYFCTG